MKKIMIMHACMCIILSMAFGGILEARMTINGSTGLLTVPSAEALKYKEISVGYDYLFSDRDRDEDAFFYKATLGTFQDWEIGVVGGSEPDEGMFLNVKYYMMSDNSRYPVMVAIGMENLSSEDNTSVYMVASKRFKGGLSGHFGFRALFSDEIDPSIMAGLEYFVNNNIVLITDISGQQQDYAVNSGIDYQLSPEVTIRAAILDIGKVSDEGLRYSMGIVLAKFL